MYSELELLRYGRSNLDRTRLIENVTGRRRSINSYEGCEAEAPCTYLAIFGMNWRLYECGGALDCLVTMLLGIIELAMARFYSTNP
jgi:hypothetical protein